MITPTTIELENPYPATNSEGKMLMSLAFNGFVTNMYLPDAAWLRYITPQLVRSGLNQPSFANNFNRMDQDVHIARQKQ